MSLPNNGSSLRLIHVGTFRPGEHLDLVMDDEKGMALAYFSDFDS